MSEEQTQATEQWEPDELMNPRPKWPKVIGVISIVLGALGLTCGGLGMVMVPFSSKMLEPMLEGDPVPYGMQFTGLDIVVGLLGLLLSLLLLFAGITATTRRPITRPLHLTFAICSIPLNIWSALNQINKQALNEQWAQDFPNNPMAQGMSGSSNAGAQIGQVVGLVMLLIFGIGIPLFYLIWFGLLKTKPEQITGEEEGVY